VTHFGKLSEFGKGIPDFVFDTIGRFDIILGDETPNFEYVVGNGGKNPKARVHELLQEFSLSPLDILSNLFRRQLFHMAGLELVIARTETGSVLPAAMERAKEAARRCQAVENDCRENQ
jgi:hypothetical protein